MKASGGGGGVLLVARIELISQIFGRSKLINNVVDWSVVELLV